MDLNAEELYRRKKRKERKANKEYIKVYKSCNRKIKRYDTILKETSCLFDIPQFILGVPSYDKISCITYLMYKLKKNNFKVKCTNADKLIIGWDKLNFDPTAVDR